MVMESGSALLTSCVIIETEAPSLIESRSKSSVCVCAFFCRPLAGDCLAEHQHGCLLLLLLLASDLSDHRLITDKSTSVHD